MSPRSRSLCTALLALAVLAPLGLSSPAEAATSTTIRPAVLDRGSNPGVPQLLGRTTLDGDRRITVPGREVQLYGASGDDYVVGVWTDDGRSRIQRVAADGSRQTIVGRIRGDVVLSGDGKQIVETTIRSSGSTIATVRAARSGRQQLRRTFAGYVRVLDADRGSRCWVGRHRRAPCGGSSWVGPDLEAPQPGGLLRRCPRGPARQRDRQPLRRRLQRRLVGVGAPDESVAVLPPSRDGGRPRR